MKTARTASRVAAAGLLGGLLGIGGVAYSYGYSVTSWQQYTNNYITYEHRSDILTTSGQDPSSLHSARNTVNTNVPAGWMGVQPRIFDQIPNSPPPALCVAGQWSYNTTATIGLGRAVYGECGECGGFSAYYGRGQSRAIKQDGTWATHTALTAGPEDW